jgi:hypothetical protein
MLKIGDNFRNRGLGNSQLYGRLGHAAVLDDRVEHVQVAQPEPTTDLAFPVNFWSHR